MPKKNQSVKIDIKFKKNKGVCVLLTATGGFGTPSVIDCLRNNYENRKIRIICTDIKRNGIAHHKADGSYQLPKGSSNNKYIQRLITVCKKEKVFKIAKKLSRRVVIRHDYLPFEFCVCVFKNNKLKKDNTFLEYYNF